MIFKKQVVHFPKSTLISGAFGSLVGLVRKISMVQDGGKDEHRLPATHVRFYDLGFNT